MAGRLTFHFSPGTSPLHNWDARCKLAGMLLLTAGMLTMNIPALGLFALVFIAAFSTAGLPWKVFLSEMKWWGVFLTLIFCVQAFSLPGSEPVPDSWLPASDEALRAAALTSLRLLLVLCYATLFTFVTRPRDLQDALAWFLKPFPFIPARRIALMVSLTLRFLPLIMDNADDVRMATRSRLGRQCRNPLQRIRYFALPVFRRSLIRADQTALALAARGYREDLPVRLPAVPARDLIGLAVLAAAVACAVVPLPHPLIEGLGHLVDIARHAVSVP